MKTKNDSAPPPLTVPAGVAYVVTASRDQKVKLWETAGGFCVHTFVGHDGWVNGIAFHPNGRYMFSAADDGSIRIWELKTGRCVRKIDTYERFVSSLAWTRQTAGTSAPDALADGSDAIKLMNVFACGCWDNSVKVWMP
ncbi:hypothetical protein HGRIS_012184 [Hohenbuehelia grisea]